MGLDVYLYRHEDRAAQQALDAYWETDDADKAIAVERHGAMAEDPFLVAGTERIAFDHPEHPDHFFKVGYWRSSYNAAGIDSVLGEAIGKGLKDCVVGLTGYENHGIDWGASLRAAEDVAAELAAYRQSDEARFHTVRVPTAVREDAIARDTAGVLAEFHNRRRENEQREDGFRCFSSAAGLFNFAAEPFRVRSVQWRKGLFGAEPVLVVESSPGHLQWYADALQIVRSTILHVLDSGEPEKFSLTWSG